MTEAECRTLKTIIVAREEIAYNHKLPLRGRNGKGRQGETEKDGMEIDEVYIQGMRDCLRLLTFLGAFNGLEGEL